MICFEGTPLQTLSGPFYSISGEESDGQICVNVMRGEGDVNMFDFESFIYEVSEVFIPIFGGGTAAGEFVSRIIVPRYLPHNVYYPDVRITVFVHVIRNTYAIVFGVGELANGPVSLDENLLMFTPYQAYVCAVYILELTCSVSL